MIVLVVALSDFQTGSYPVMHFFMSLYLMVLTVLSAQDVIRMLLVT